MKYKKSDIGFDGRHFVFAKGVYKELKIDFWGIDFEEEIKKAERWLLFNPPKRDHRRYLCNWLNNSKLQHSIKLKDEPTYRRSCSDESGVNPPSTRVVKLIDELKKRLAGRFR